MSVVDGTTVTFTLPASLGDAELDVIEDHIRNTYDPAMADKIVEGLYNDESELITIVQATMTVTATITIKSRSDM